MKIHISYLQSRHFTNENDLKGGVLSEIYTPSIIALPKVPELFGKLSLRSGRINANVETLSECGALQYLALDEIVVSYFVSNCQFSVPVSSTPDER
jgi:hypothetical protein